MSALLDKGAAKYVALETFKRNGDAVSTPVWITREDSRLFVFTQGSSWKVKRVRNTGRVRVAESDARGTVEGTFAEGQGKVLTDSAEVGKQLKRLYSKYGLFARLFVGYSKLRGTMSDNVVIEITEAQA